MNEFLLDPIITTKSTRGLRFDDVVAAARAQAAEYRRMNDINVLANGGGLSRSKDYGSKKKPYPSVKSGDFAGGGRSYPIPTKDDAVDALRLAGLHHRADVKAKVYRKYPSLKHPDGGVLTTEPTEQQKTIGDGINNWFNNWYSNRTKQLQQNADYLKQFGISENESQSINNALNDVYNVKEYYSPINVVWGKEDYSDLIPITDASKKIKRNVTDFAIFKDPRIKDISKNKKELFNFAQSALSRTTGGYFTPRLNYIYHSGTLPRETVSIHEKTHRLDHSLPRMMEAIMMKKATGGEKNWFLNTNYNYDDYLDDPDEIYARLNQLRYNINADPNKIYTREDLDDLRKNPLFGFDLERYNDDFLLFLLNDVADNSTVTENNYLAKGGPLDQSPVTTVSDNPNVNLDLMWKNNQSIGNNRKMNMSNMEQIDNYLISKNVPLYQRQAILYTILQESGADALDAHGNGYYGLVGWSVDRYNAIKDKSLLGQAEYLYDTLYNGDGSVDWNHGGTGSGYNSWKDARKAFVDAQDFDTAMRALTYGYVRPAADVKAYRLQYGSKHF